MIVIIGIFGKMENIENEYEEVDTACWYNVRKGKANILVALDDNELTSYDVEITNINYINNNKNIKVKITDEALIERTGGIVQGMSGTPLMQNRKINWCNKLCKCRRSKCCICNICGQINLINKIYRVKY